MENRKFIIAIVVLSILLVISLGFIGYDKFLKKPDESIKTVVDGMEIDLNIFHKVGDILQDLDNAFSDSTNKYFGYIYGNNNVMIEKMDPKVAAYASIYKEIRKTGEIQYISSNAVKSNLTNMFGKYVAYKTGAIDWTEESYIPFDKETNLYTQQLPFINPLQEPTYFATEVSTALGESEIIIKRKSYYVEYELDESGINRAKALIYTDKDKKTLITTVNLKNGSINEKEIIAKYSSKLNTYMYTFKEYNNTDYVLYSIEKLRK